MPKIFNPYWKCKYDELITFYPRYYQDIAEMQAILKAEGKLADGVQSSMEKMLMNNFIDTADEQIIYKIESYLGISLMKQKTLGERRRLIKSFFAGRGKVSEKGITEMIRAYMDVDIKCDFCPYDDTKNNMLNIKFDRGNEETVYLSDIYALLSKMLPAHIAFSISIYHSTTVPVIISSHISQNHIIKIHPLMINSLGLKTANTVKPYVKSGHVIKVHKI